MITFKDLCIDVTDAATAARFVAPLLGLGVERVEPDLAKLSDDVPEHTVWLNRVPEPRTVKNRIHLDVDVAAVSDVTAAGAVVDDDTQAWTVLVQEEVGELCAFVRPPGRLARYRLYELVVDCADAGAVACWWAERFGTTAGAEDDFFWIDPVAGLPWEVVFGVVPEPKTVKNRVHWDVWGDTAELLDAGATLLRGRADGRDWDVLADPEGNEFCVFAPA